MKQQIQKHNNLNCTSLQVNPFNPKKNHIFTLQANSQNRKKNRNGRCWYESFITGGVVLTLWNQLHPHNKEEHNRRVGNLKNFM